MKGYTVTPTESEDLAKRAKAGDASAFERLIDMHRGRLQSWIQSRVKARIRHKVDVESVLQETQLRACQSIQDFTCHHDESFFRWLCANGWRSPSEY